MFQRLFARRRPNVAATAQDDGGHQIRHIVVPRSAVDAVDTEPYRLVGAVVDFVNHVVASGLYTRSEVPPAAIQAYHCDYYFAQVNNGGHAQFVGNSLQNLDFILTDIDLGLIAAGADDYHRIFGEMADWIVSNPRDARKQTGFEGGIAPELAALDAPFYDLDDEPGMTAYLARWIADLPCLKIVEDESLPKVMEGITALNGERDPRAIAASITQLTLQLSDLTHLGFGLAATSRPQPEPLVQLGGASQMEITPGREDFAYVIRTVASTRFGVQTHRGFELFERIETGPSPIAELDQAAAEDGAFDNVLPFHAPKIGPRLAYVPRKLAEVAALVCERFHAAAAIDMMLRKLPRTPDVDYVSVRSVGKNVDGKIGATIIVVADGAKSAYSAVIESDGSRLLAEPDHEVLATASRTEIEDHAREFPVED